MIFSRNFSNGSLPRKPMRLDARNERFQFLILPVLTDSRPFRQPQFSACVEPGNGALHKVPVRPALH
jgi:hypothetical protein